MERQVRPFSKQWKLVERAESFAASRTRAFVYFSDDPWRCAFYPGSEPDERKSATAQPVIFRESDAHGPTPNVVMVGFIGAPSQWQRFDKRLAKL